MDGMRGDELFDIDGMRGDELLRDVLEGKILGKKRTGKPTEGMIEDLKKELGEMW